MEVSSTAFCAAATALHEAMRSPNASYSREPKTPSWLPPAVPAVWVCGVRIRTTVIPEYDVRLIE